MPHSVYSRIEVTIHDSVGSDKEWTRYTYPHGRRYGGAAFIDSNDLAGLSGLRRKSYDNRDAEQAGTFILSPVTVQASPGKSEQEHIEPPGSLGHDGKRRFVIEEGVQVQ